jgi:NADPH:quinone reductase-like Zn-dependent oxidoreductase
MKAVVVPSQGSPMEIWDNLELPQPGDDQILVKSVYAAVNPVYVETNLTPFCPYAFSETFLIDYGVLVLSWPLVPGCDAGGVVVKAGKNAISPLGEQFNEGDKVCGCTRLGSPGYGTFQEYVSTSLTRSSGAEYISSSWTQSSPFPCQRDSALLRHAQSV